MQGKEVLRDLAGDIPSTKGGRFFFGYAALLINDVLESPESP